MLKDIQSSEDIRGIVNAFYDKVKKDTLLKPFFTEYVKINWDKHLPVMTAFWQNVVFNSGSYSGNPIQVHRQLNKLFPLSAEHFKQWLLIFTMTVDEMFEGEKAELIKQRAQSIATIMEMKIGNEGF